MRLARLLAASSNVALLPAHGETHADDTGASFYCRPCLRWVDIPTGRGIPAAKFSHEMYAHREIRGMYDDAAPPMGTTRATGDCEGEATGR